MTAPLSRTQPLAVSPAALAGWRQLVGGPAEARYVIAAMAIIVAQGEKIDGGPSVGWYRHELWPGVQLEVEDGSVVGVHFAPPVPPRIHRRSWS